MKFRFFRFFGIWQYKFKSRSWFHLNLYRGIWSSSSYLVDFGDRFHWNFSGIYHTAITFKPHDTTPNLLVTYLWLFWWNIGLFWWDVGLFWCNTCIRCTTYGHSLFVSNCTLWNLHIPYLGLFWWDVGLFWCNTYIRCTLGASHLGISVFRI